MAEPAVQTELLSTDRGRVMAMDSAYHVAQENSGRDVVINASYCGVLPARFIAEQRPRGAVGVDCGVGPAGASISGLWYLEALQIPAAVADVMTVRLGNGVDLFEHGVISFCNQPARDCGVQAGMSVRDAAVAILSNDPVAASANEVTNRTVVDQGPDGRLIVCIDSVAFGLAEDVDNVLVTAGHTGRSAVPYLLHVRPYGFVCSDGGKGRDDAGVVGIHMVVEHGLAGATVDARRAAMGDGLSSYHDGVISAVNSLALAAGVEEGMSCAQAARLLVERNRGIA